MIGSLHLIPPFDDEVVTDYDGSAPDLATIQDMVGSTYLNRPIGLTTFEVDGEIVPSAGIANAEGESQGLVLNGPGMRLLHVAQMRVGKASPSSVPRPLWGNIVIAHGDDEFMTAIHDLFPVVEPPPPVDPPPP